MNIKRAPFIAVLALAAPALAMAGTPQASDSTHSHAMLAAAESASETGPGTVGTDDGQAGGGADQSDFHQGDHSRDSRAGGAANPDERLGGSGNPISADDVISQRAPNHVRSDKLIGNEVINHRDEAIGNIGDLLIDREGEIAGLVIQTGGFLGMAEREVAVPWEEVQLTADEDGNVVARINIDEQLLEEAPEFEDAEDEGLFQ